MARQCEVCGKQAQLGNQVAIRGKKKYLGGVGTKITGISRRKFRPNLQRVKVSESNGSHTAKLVCVQCLRSGAVTKIVRQAPFTVPKKTPVKAPAAKAPAGKAAAR
jgi:large subunit ribosomal protein L28